MISAKDLKIPFEEGEGGALFLDQFLYLPKRGKMEPQQFTFFENLQPIAIEFCSGNGHWIQERATQFPHLNWIAVEKKFERARKIWVKAKRYCLKNLFVV